MKSRFVAIFWSMVMIAVGVALVLRERGFIDFNQLSTNFWAVGFGVLSLFFFLTYFFEGVRNWGWLFPALILGAIALIMGLEDTQLGQILSGSPVLISIAIPFLVVFAFEPRKNWWALIPAWVMFALSLVVLFADKVDGNLIGTFVLYSIALPFLAVYLLNRSRRWALIPFAVLSVVGLIPLLENFMGGEVIGLVTMFLFAIPFFVVYFWSKNNWWALIPAGVFTSIGLVVLASLSSVLNSYGNGFNPLGTALLLLGFGLTFGVLWLLRNSQPTDWAKYPALGLFAASGLALLIGENMQLFWPVILIVAGGIILLLGFIRKPTSMVEKPKEKIKN